MPSASSGAFKEIFLSVGTRGVERTKTELSDLERASKRTTDAVATQAKSVSRLGEVSERFGKIKEKVNQNLERFRFLSEGLTVLLGGGLVGAIGGAVASLIQLGGALFGVEEKSESLAEAFKIVNDELDKITKRSKDALDKMEQFRAKAVGGVSSFLGVDPASLSPQTLAVATGLFEKQNALSEKRVSLERQYIEKLKEERTAVEELNRTQSAPSLSRVMRARNELQGLEAALNASREEQIDINRQRRELLPNNTLTTAGAGVRKPASGIKRTGADSLDKLVTLSEKALFDEEEKQREEVNRYLAVQTERRIKDNAQSVADQVKANIEDSQRQAEEIRLSSAEALARAEANYNQGKQAGGRGGVFSLIGETDEDKIRGIKDAIYEGIITPAEVANEALSNMAMGFADAAAAAILEGKSFKAAANEMLRSIARQALARSIFEGAAALASLAILDFRGAALHGQAAGTFAIVAGMSALGAAMTGGVRSSSGAGGGSGAGAGGGSRGAPNANTSGGNGSNGAVVYNFTVNYNGLRTNREDHNFLVGMLNRYGMQPGSAKINMRAVA